MWFGSEGTHTVTVQLQLVQYAVTNHLSARAIQACEPFGRLAATAAAALQYEYLWADGVKYKKPVRLSAPEYVDKLFDWVEAQVRTCVPAVCTLEGSTDRQLPSARQHRV